MKNKRLKILIILLGISIGIKGMDSYELLESDGLSVEKSEEITKQNKRQKIDHCLNEGLQEESKEEFESSDFIDGGLQEGLTFPTNENYGIEGLFASLNSRGEPKEIVTESQDFVKQADKKKKYICKKSGCGKSYTEKHNLQKHINSVHKEERFSCTKEKCDKLFTRPEDLKRHIKTAHEGKRYFCIKERCGRSYSRQYALQNHIKSIHEGKRYVCTEKRCDKSYTNNQNLQRHIKSDHSK